MRRILAMRFITMLCMLAASVTALADDVASARAVFEQNIAAIRNRDRDAYLDLYLHSDALVRTGASGFVTGFEEFAKGAGAQWPDTIEATDMRLTPLRAGMVYGTYRYRVRYGARENSGISERIFVETPQGWRIALTGAIDAPPGTPPSPRAITNVTLIDGQGGAPLPNATVVIRDGKIECAGACAVPDGVNVIDGKGMWATPGLIDAHVHFSQTGWADGRPDALDVRDRFPYEKTIAGLRAHPEVFARSYLCSGVTGVFDVGGYAWTLDLARRFENDTAAPHVTAAGPLLSTRDHWLNLAAERQFIHLKDAATARDGVAYLAAQGSRAIKVWYINENADAINAAGAAAASAGLPLIVHATELAGAKAAVRAGAKLLVHSVWDLPIDDEFIALLKEHGTILTPTLTVAGGYVRMFEGKTTIDDPNRCVDDATRAKVATTVTLPAGTDVAARAERTKQREAIAAANLKRLVAAGIPIATGTDAGNPLTLHGPSIYAEMEAMQNAGMTPMQVLVASTATAARAARLDDVTGTIEKGKDADLLLLSADPSRDAANFRKLRFVVRGGVVRGVDELSAMARNPQPSPQP
ncbi:MAG TPA: amidohydrolase family protein [Thermoanaerobaculia bacterium]|nr:amidohydrolase family protein [Thermoanaerobaculia bacterium]